MSHALRLEKRIAVSAAGHQIDALESALAAAESDSLVRPAVMGEATQLLTRLHAAQDALVDALAKHPVEMKGEGLA